MSQCPIDVISGQFPDEVLDERWKGFPALPPGTTVSQFVASRPALLDSGFTWPVLALRESAVRNNIEVLARWCSDHGLSLAPHGKTTMSPSLFSRQLVAGAWGITAATPWQARAYRSWGVQRILLANELVDADFVAWLLDELADPHFDFICLVDSVAGVRLLADAMARPAKPLCVLVELGIGNGRTGARTEREAMAICDAVRDQAFLSLRGVAGYEGPLGHHRDEATLRSVREYVLRLHALLQRLDDDGLLDPQADEYLLSCGGSVHVDVVSQVLAQPLTCSRPVRRLLRSGAYVTHDHGLYARTSSLAGQLHPAAEVWCQVISRPQPRLALVGAGHRDVPSDQGLPVVLYRRSRSTGELSSLSACVTRLNDQHAFLDLDSSAVLDVGDLVCLGISHPCTAHDRWQLVPLIDDKRRVVDCARSYF